MTTQPEPTVPVADARAVLRVALDRYRTEIVLAQTVSAELLAGHALAERVGECVDPKRPWAPSWAKVADHPCVTVLCSHCRQDLDCDGEGGSWHYDDVAEALRAAIGYGWVQDTDRLLCRPCAEEIVCARDGHKWGDRHHREGFTARDGTVYRPDEWWECTVCEHTVHERPEGWVPPPAPDPSSPTLLDGDPWAGEPS